MEFDHSTGELFIVTDIGLVSYRSDASEQDEAYETTTVFPNPVKPDYFGPITIQGIRYDSDVKITDVAGNLVYKTTSNGGTATWNGKTLSGENVAAGVYLIWTATNEAASGKDKKVGKVVVIR
jgi:flagellar hook assembly protein FlgD